MKIVSAEGQQCLSSSVRFPLCFDWWLLLLSLCFVPLLELVDLVFMQCKALVTSLPPTTNLNPPTYILTDGSGLMDVGNFQNIHI